MAGRLQVAHLFPVIGSLLELPGGWYFWIYHQPAHRIVLYAGTKHHSRTRTRSTFRCVRHVGNRLMLFVLRSMYRKQKWNDKLIKFTFWTLNAGLLLMVVSLLPVGLMQTFASVNHGMWYARSAEFMQQPVVNVFKWSRIIGDTVFGIGTPYALPVCLSINPEKINQQISPFIHGLHVSGCLTDVQSFI